MIGRTLAHYHIRESIGRGGMGEVYRADDLRLSRQVAIKVLSRELQADPDGKSRFEREGRVLASLNHPNIVQIYDIGDVHGVQFIAMELVAGTPLSRLIRSGGLAIAHFFDLAIPLADAIAAAHRVGVLHRDIKPANLVVDGNGRLKVLDFGIAKRVYGSGVSGPTTTFATAPHAVTGTVAYMSPEQLQGLPLDERGDVFSIGVVLYEMLTGRHPFARDSAAATVSSILRDDPASPAAGRPDVPLPLATLVLRCLAKDPERRKQSALDLRNDLEDLRGIPRAIGVGDPPRRAHAGALAVAAIAGATIGAAVTWSLWLALPRTAREPAPVLANPVQITFAAGVEDHATWAPDGARLAYESEEAGNWDIWAAQPGGGVSVNLTKDNRGDDRFPSWSPTGQLIAFVSQRDTGPGLYVMSALGGSPRKLLDIEIPTTSPRTPSWSSDSTTITINVGGEGEEDVRVVNVLSGATTSVAIPRQVPNWKIDLRRSPSGRFLSYVQGLFNSFIPEVSKLWVVPDRGTPIQVTDGQSKDRSPAFSSDERTLLFLSARGGAMDLWQQHLDTDGRPDGHASQITVGLGLRSFALSPDGRKVALSRGRQVSNIWRIPVLASRRATWADAEQITAEHAWIQFFDVSPDGTRLVVGSDRTGNQDLWTLPVSGGTFMQLTTHPAPEDAPAWSRDGGTVLFRCFRNSNQEVCAIPPNGGVTEQRTMHPDEDTMPAPSPDGKAFVFVSRRRGEFRDLWVGGDANGVPREIVQNANFPTYSPDARWLLYTSETDLRLWLLPATTIAAAPQRLTDGRAFLGRWSPNGKVVYYTPRADRAGNIWAVSIADRREYPVTDLKGRRGTLGWGLAADDRYVYFTWWENLGDLWVMDVVRPKMRR